MSEDVYYRLGERLNENRVKLPPVDPFLEILREYYTEEQGAVGAEFPLGSHKLGPLAKSMGRDEAATATRPVPKRASPWYEGPG